MAAASVLQGRASAAKLEMGLSRSFRGGRRKENVATKVLLRPPSIYISANPSDVNPDELKKLYDYCNLSSHRFPNRDSSGRVQSIDVRKLRLVLRHSSVVVSVFCRSDAVSFSDFDTHHDTTSSNQNEDWKNLLCKLMPLTLSNRRLVGFGRAVSDNGLTASIHDVMVVPPLQRMGIGRMVVRRILRTLASKEVYDISALCSKEERLFFEACGFGDDILCTTTMMYTRVHRPNAPIERHP